MYKNPKERINLYENDISAYSRLLHTYRYGLVKRNAYGKFLDAGCGTGTMFKVLPSGAEYYGIDISMEAIEMARKNFGRKDRFIVYDGKHIPFPDEFFDTAGCLEVIEHLSLEERAQYLEEIKRVIKPGGIIVLSTPNRNYPIKIIKKKLLKWGNPFHKHEFTTKEFMDFLKQHSLRIIDTDYIGDPLNIFGNLLARKIYRLHPRFQKNLFRYSLALGRLFKDYCNDVLVVCKKT